MLLKSADDKSRRLALLEELQNSALLDSGQKDWLRIELHRCKKGIQGERDSAHYLNSYFKDAENHVLLHDLRFDVDGDVAQIDHLILNRAGHVFLIETKNYSGDMVVNEYGEYTVHYDKDSFGIPSPWEQSRRHERILAKLLERLGITRRLDKQPEFHHVVMMHPKSAIKRPDPKSFDTSFLIKADQFPTWHAKFADRIGFVDVLKAAVNMRSLETLTEWGEKLKRQHRPENPLDLPPFMAPKAKAEVPIAAASRVSKQVASTAQARTEEAFSRNLICDHCGDRITRAVGDFCLRHSHRFNGLQYCMEHQKMF